MNQQPQYTGIDWEQKEPASPPTSPNVVSVLSKMLENQIASQQIQMEINTNPQAKNFAFYLDFPIQNQLPKCQIQVTNETKVETALKQAIDKFKNILSQKGYDMDVALENYTLRLSKKNGKPKTDMPSIDLKQKFSQIKVNISSIQVKKSGCIKPRQDIKIPEIQVKQQQSSVPSQQTGDAFSKTTSYYSIGSQIMVEQPQKKGEVLGEQQAMHKQKNSNCMFSFC